jgi:phospholipase C
MAGQSRDNALDHVVVVVFENRSLDNLLGRLYGPGDGKTFEGVLGKDLSNRSRTGPSTAPTARRCRTR